MFFEQLFGFANLFFHRKYSTTAVGVYVCEMETPPVCYFDYFFHSADIRSLLRGAGVDRQKGSVFGAN